MHAVKTSLLTGDTHWSVDKLCPKNLIVSVTMCWCEISRGALNLYARGKSQRNIEGREREGGGDKKRPSGLLCYATDFPAGMPKTPYNHTKHGVCIAARGDVAQMVGSLLGMRVV